MLIDYEREGKRNGAKWPNSYLKMDVFMRRWEKWTGFNWSLGEAWSMINGWTKGWGSNDDSSMKLWNKWTSRTMDEKLASFPLTFIICMKQKTICFLFWVNFCSEQIFLHSNESFLFFISCLSYNHRETRWLDKTCHSVTMYDSRLEPSHKSPKRSFAFCFLMLWCAPATAQKPQVSGNTHHSKPAWLCEVDTLENLHECFKPPPRLSFNFLPVCVSLSAFLHHSVESEQFVFLWKSAGIHRDIAGRTVIQIINSCLIWRCKRDRDGRIDSN